MDPVLKLFLGLLILKFTMLLSGIGGEGNVYVARIAAENSSGTGMQKL